MSLAYIENELRKNHKDLKLKGMTMVLYVGKDIQVGYSGKQPTYAISKNGKLLEITDRPNRVMKVVEDLLNGVEMKPLFEFKRGRK